jgi:ATP adenylyltransferase
MDDSILWTPWRMPYLRGEDKANSDGCIFCAKARGEDDAGEYVVARSAHVFVALNRYPYNNGHALIIPYAHVPSLEDLPSEALLDLMQTVNQTIAALRRVYRPQAFNVGANIGTAAGAGIAEHFHMHVIPRWAADTNFMGITAGTRVIPDLLDATYRQLRDAWNDAPEGE